jgi:Acetyltransferase (GNAT) domain
MRVRRVALADVTQQDALRWRDLAQRALESNAFLDPDFLIPGGKPPAEAQPIELLLVEDDDDLLLVMASHIVTRNVRGFKVTALTPYPPFMRRYTPRCYPLVDPDRPTEALEALLTGLRQLHLPNFVDLEGFPTDGPLADALAAVGASAGIPFVERGAQDFAFRRRTRDAAFPESSVGAKNPRAQAPRLKMDHLNPSTSKRYAQYYRGLERSVGGELSFTDRGEDPAAIDEFLDLQVAGWKGDATRGGRAFRLVGEDAWFTDVAAAFRASGRLSVFSLAGPTGTIYLQIAFRSGRGLFAAADVYDESFAKFRPGNLGRLAVMEHSMSDTSADFFDPNMHPRNTASAALYPDRRRFATYLLAQHGVLPKALVRAIPLARGARDRLTSRRGLPPRRAPEIAG